MNASDMPCPDPGSGADAGTAHDAPLRCLREGPLAQVIINRPAKRNAITAGIWESLPPLMARLSADPSVRAVVFRGAGDAAFSAGADISEFAHVYRDAHSASRYNDAVRQGQLSVERFDKPTLALIHGACVGGGCGLALACDVRMGADDVRMGITPSKLGVAYSLPDTRRLVVLAGPSAAKDILYSGRLLDAAEALRLGLLDRVIAKADLDNAVRDYVALWLRNSSGSIAVAKAMINSITGVAPRPEAELETSFQACFDGADFKEGAAAFLEKRSPRFG